MVYKYTHVRFLAAGVIQSRSDKNRETQKCDVDGTIALNVSQYLYLSQKVRYTKEEILVAYYGTAESQ